MSPLRGGIYGKQWLCAVHSSLHQLTCENATRRLPHIAYGCSPRPPTVLTTSLQAREAVAMTQRLADEQANVSLFAFGVGRGVDKVPQCMADSLQCWQTHSCFNSGQLAVIVQHFINAMHRVVSYCSTDANPRHCASPGGAGAHHRRSLPQGSRRVPVHRPYGPRRGAVVALQHSGPEQRQRHPHRASSAENVSVIQAATSANRPPSGANSGRIERRTRACTVAAPLRHGQP